MGRDPWQERGQQNITALIYKPYSSNMGYNVKAKKIYITTLWRSRVYPA